MHTQDDYFNWNATWKFFLGATFGVDFLAPSGATTAFSDFSFIVLFSTEITGFFVSIMNTMNCCYDRDTVILAGCG